MDERKDIIMWKITRNMIDGREANCKKHLSKDWSEEEVKKVRKLYKFRLSDDDREIYFYGVSTDCCSEAAFRPLDELGRPGYGCTNIEYKNENGSWELL